MTFWRVQEVKAVPLVGGAVEQTAVNEYADRQIDRVIVDAARQLVTMPNGPQRLARLAQAMKTLQDDAAQHVLKGLVK